MLHRRKKSSLWRTQFTDSFTECQDTTEAVLGAVDTAVVKTQCSNESCSFQWIIKITFSFEVGRKKWMTEKQG